MTCTLPKSNEYEFYVNHRSFENVYRLFAVSDKTTHNAAATEAKWEGVRQYLDPNPQLKGTDLGRYAPKVRES